MSVPEAKPAPAWRSLALLMAGSGVLHFVMPKPFESIVPKQIGHEKLLVQVSGAAELAVAAGLALPRTRRLAGLVSAGLLVGVFPANIDMTVRALRSKKASPIWKAGLVARLPLQIPPVIRSLQLFRAKA